MTGNSSSESEYGDFSERRNRRVRLVAWITIISLILMGGGATVLALILN